jgi:hypothetical protein
MKESDQELVPRNGHTLVAGVVARISGCAKQKDVGLENQVDHTKKEVAELCQVPAEYRVEPCAARECFRRICHKERKL